MQYLMNEHLLKSLESSVNKMGVALRIQFERWTEITDKFKIGDPFKLPVISIPPDTTNKDNNKIINGRNSLNVTSRR